MLICKLWGKGWCEPLLCHTDNKMFKLTLRGKNLLKGATSFLQDRPYFGKASYCSKFFPLEDDPY